MTRTEERLADALGAVARGVREEALPPLRARGLAYERRAHRRRWVGWLAPVAAAAAVILIAVLVSTVHLFSGRQTGAHVRPAGPPRYYVSAEPWGIQVRRTATGAVTATVPRPVLGGRGSQTSAVGLAAGDRGREFVAEYSGPAPHGGNETRLYSFRLTSAGRVAGMSLVRGGRLRGMLGGSALAVSPDGSKVALTVYRAGKPGQLGPVQIAVINLRTGVRSYWTGGLGRRPGFRLGLASISWAPGSDSLVFFSQWCRAANGFCGPGTPAGQARTLRVIGGGGQLSSGSVLLHGSAGLSNVVQALLTPDGKALDIVTLTGPHRGWPHLVPQILSLVRVPLTPGGHARLLYRGDHGVVGPAGVVFLSSDASGRYLLLASGRDGWIDHGRLRLLAPRAGAFSYAW